MQYLRLLLVVAFVAVLLCSSIEAKKAKKSKSSAKSIVDEDDTKSFENSDKMKDYIKNLNKKTSNSEESTSPEKKKELEDEEKKLKIAAALIADEHKHSSREHANILHRLGRNLHQQEKFEELVQVAKKIVQIHEELDGPEHFNTAQALGNLGASSYHIGLKKDVEHAMKRALYIFIKKFGPDSQEVRLFSQI
jgi:hypothetical protein